MSSASSNKSVRKLAEARLQRQNARIQQADAALTAPPATERTRGRSRGHKWKPLDYTSDSSRHSDHGVPLTDSHAYSFQPRSSATSLSRSISSLSIQPGFAEMERADSIADTSGFQLYTGRRGKRNSSFRDPDEKEKAATVEVPYDKRETYNIFGNALPGPDFITTHLGPAEGHVQFIQHPNGDVAAHQWDQVRFVWDNIGHFSNIRKKIEGQLATDRLRGETRSQTLQRNSLVYFRAIAKQREAASMGLPFGQKEIQALLPDQGISPLEPYFNKPADKQESPMQAKQNESVVGSSVATAPPPPIPRRSSLRPPYVPPAVVSPVIPVIPAAQRAPSLPSVIMPKRSEDPFHPGDQYATTTTKPSLDYPAMVARLPQGVAPRALAASLPVFGTTILNTPTHKDTPVKQITPSREAMRGQLYKLEETARERNLTQGQIGRTVLFDPFQTGNNSKPPPPPPPSQTSAEHSSSNETYVTAKSGSNLRDSVPDNISSNRYTTAISNIGGVSIQTTISAHSGPKKQTADEILENWWTGDKRFARNEDYYQSIKAASRLSGSPSSTRSRSNPIGSTPSSTSTPVTISSGSSSNKHSSSPAFRSAPTRIMLSVHDTLASYVQGPASQRRDFWSRWTPPPDYCVASGGAGGNHSFFDKEWGTPPERVGRDSRYQMQKQQYTHPGHGGSGGLRRESAGGGGGVVRPDGLRPLPGDVREGSGRFVSGYTTGGMPITEERRRSAGGVYGLGRF